MEAVRFSDASVLIRVTRRNIPEDGILQIIIRKSEKKDYLGDLGRDRMMLNLTLKKHYVRTWTGLSSPWIEHNGGIPLAR
jgi:hypothetical protein